MSMNFRAIAQALVVLSPVFSFVAVAAPHQAQAASDSDACPAYERKAQLSSEPLLVNPGGKCPAWRFRFEFMLYASEEPPKTCYFAPVAGSEKEYGPFCTEGANFAMDVPGPIEWLWSSRPVTVYIKLCASPSDCR
jgi:hypothetical protein